MLSCFQSLRPGKAVKKRKGQYGGCNSQLNKKKNQQGLASTSDDASEKTDPTLNELWGPVIGSEGDSARTNGLLKVKRKKIHERGAKVWYCEKIHTRWNHK